MWFGNIGGSRANFKWAITYPLLGLGLYFSEKLGNRVCKGSFSKLLFNLLPLAILATVIDLIVWHATPSLERFLSVFVR